MKKSTYIHNNKVQPAPGIGEVFDKSICNPFQQHLKNEDVRENFIRIVQDDLYSFPRVQINVLKGLWNACKTNTAIEPS